MRVKRQGDDLCDLRRRHFLKRFFGKRAPVPHAGANQKVAVGAQGLFKRCGLFFGFGEDGRAAADAPVVGHALGGAAISNDAGNGCLQKRRAQADDLSVGEQVEEERPHVLKPFGTAQVQE